MRLLVLSLTVLLSVLLTVTSASAREIVGKGTLAEKPIVAYSDGLWRFDDSVGEICSAIEPFLTLCALPSQWSPHPITDLYDRKLFWNDKDFISEVFVLEDPSGGMLSEKSVVGFIERTTAKETGLVALQIDKAQTELLGSPAKTRVFQTIGVSAFTYVNLEKRWVVAMTRQLGGTTLYLDDHKKIHSDFLTMLRIGD